MIKLELNVMKIRIMKKMKILTMKVLELKRRLGKTKERRRYVDRVITKKSYSHSAS